MIPFSDFVTILFKKIRDLHLYNEMTWCIVISLILVLMYYAWSIQGRVKMDFLIDR